MKILFETVVILGVAVQDILEGWILALFVAVISFDTYISFRDNRMLIFNILQVLGLVAGYYWAMTIFEQQDVAGPWAWGRVVGIWVVGVTIFHVWYTVRFLKSRM